MPMEVTELQVVVLHDASGAGEARRAAADMASRLGFEEVDVGRVALVVTEAATNAVKHGGGGEILLYVGRRQGVGTFGCMTIDRGPGMANVAHCLRDGISATGSSGTGLGAIRRLSTRFDVHSSPAGTAVMAEIGGDGRRNAEDPFDLGALRVPFPGEPASGDDWAATPAAGGRCQVLLVDGLGHGIGAAEAAEQATRLFRARPLGGPAEALAVLHEGLRATRGAAAAIAEVDRRGRVVRFAGVGNVCGTIDEGGTRRSLVSSHGTLGHRVHRIREYTYPFPPGALLVLHSDGVSARWNLAAYPGLATRHPMVIAGVLYRDYRRPSDDASVVVLREAA
jgi:anti-sigma regulatory factor (Ser/Thr protein kinase)